MLVRHLQSVDYCSVFSRWSQRDSLSQPPTRATRKQRTNKLGRCYQLERPFCMLARYSLRSKTAPFTYMCLSAQVSGRETRVHAGRWHAGRSLEGYGYIGARTDTTQQTNICLGIHRGHVCPDFSYTRASCSQPMVHLIVWVVGSLQHSRTTSTWSIAISMHVWSLLLGQIWYRVAFSVLSDTYLSTFPTSFSPVYLKETLFR